MTQYRSHMIEYYLDIQQKRLMGVTQIQECHFLRIKKTSNNPGQVGGGGAKERVGLREVYRRIKGDIGMRGSNK